VPPILKSLLTSFCWLVLPSSISAEIFRPWLQSQDPVALLWQRVQNGQTKLDVTSEKAFLRHVLTELGVPMESQVLVFSKTSLQNGLITPATPRAVYFNEECYLGWVQGGMIELIGMDPELGAQFYVLERSASGTKPPVLSPSEQCLNCHESSRTERVKGLLVRSVFPDAKGQPLLRHGTFTTAPDSPLSERWGGWYVTGKHGKERHMGNVIAHEEGPGGETLVFNRESGANVMSLEHFIATEPYLTKTSDIVALMVLEHQCAVHNAMTSAAKDAKAAMERQHALQNAFGETLTEEPQGSALSVIKSHAAKLVKLLLFSGEAALPEGGIEGSEAFQTAFRHNRVETKDGRSLKDFQLLNRLFKHRCSHMIYTRMFSALPSVLKQEVYQQLRNVLQGKDPSADYAHLSDSEREHLREILAETLPESRR
jgi:hypothetical protein